MASAAEEGLLSTSMVDFSSEAATEKWASSEESEG